MWAAARPGVRDQLDAAAELCGDTSGVPARQRGVPSLPEEESPARTGPSRGCSTLRGIPGCKPSCHVSLELLCWRRDRSIGSH